MNRAIFVWPSVSRRMVRWGAIVLTALLSLGLGACGGSSGGSSSTATTVPAPDMPTNFSVVRTQSETLSATLTWSAPSGGQAPTSYEIYRSTTAGSVFSPDNHLISVAVVPGQASYTFIDNAGLSAVTTYWVVSAKNAGGETPTGEVAYKPVGPSGGDLSFGNNAAAPIIFADGYGVSKLQITGSWTGNVASIDYNTGLRPLTGILPGTVTTLPYLDSLDTYVLDGVTYYKQGTPSTWQAQWANGAGTPQQVVATWGDNLLSQTLTSSSTIRVEIALAETLSTPMTAYTMKSLYGSQLNEVQGTDGTTYDSLSAFVFATNAHLTIQKLDASGNVVYTAYDQTLWQGDGPGFLAGEVTVSGNFTYGFVWQMKNMTVPTGVSKAGTWRITFSLDPTSPVGTSNNTSIQSTTNGVLDSPTQTHIDINIGA